MSKRTVFKGKFDKNYKYASGEVNLRCICLEEGKKILIINSLKSFTGIRYNLVVEKKSMIIKAVRTSKIDPGIKIKKSKFYSLFIGFLSHKDFNYLVFVKEVIRHQFYDKDLEIFQVYKVEVISM